MIGFYEFLEDINIDSCKTFGVRGNYSQCRWKDLTVWCRHISVWFDVVKEF